MQQNFNTEVQELSMAELAQVAGGDHRDYPQTDLTDICL
jgi:hypothetical protein